MRQNEGFNDAAHCHEARKEASRWTLYESVKRTGIQTNHKQDNLTPTSICFRFTLPGSIQRAMKQPLEPKKVLLGLKIFWLNISLILPIEETQDAYHHEAYTTT